MNGHDEDNARLRELLRAGSARPPYDDVDWRALHAGIQLRARPLLGRPRTTAWWQPVAAWSGRGIPLGAAAAAALIIALSSDAVQSRPAPAPPVSDAVEFRTLEEEFAAAAPLLLADADSDQLIEAMLLYDGGDW